MITEDKIGARIKQLRLERGLTITILAEKSGFTRGYISKVENSKKAPPVSTLMSLVRAIGVNINDIFSEGETETNFTIVRKSERQAISLNGSSFGYSYEPLAPTFPKRHIDPYILTIPNNPKGTKTFQHKGEEMILVLEGKLAMTYGDKEYLVEEGDCIYFNSSIPHEGYAVGNNKVKCVMVFYNEEHTNNNLGNRKSEYKSKQKENKQIP